jgi:ArsR family transcriptional regulator, arsenate/arsenite/antimonite-responsive transcriptional repressor
MKIDYIKIFKALADDTRLKIIEMVSKETLCACDILEVFQITQPTLSYHMKQLVDADLVTGEKKGNWVHYSINTNTLESLSNYFNID